MFRLFLAFLIVTNAALATPKNVLRNGSFEGGLLYWHNISPENDLLVHDAAVGEYALRIAKGNVMSAPFVAERGQPMTVSFFVKGEAPGRVCVQMPPSAREVGTRAKRLWSSEAEQSAEIGTDWKRVSFTWNADVPADGFWPNPHYLLQIGGHDHPILVDGVTVTVGKEGTSSYVPYREIEAIADCTNLPGWKGAAGNIFSQGATAQMAAHVSNPGSRARDVVIRWQLVDYEGEVPLTPPHDEQVTIPAGKTYSEITPILLTRNGTVFARLSVLAVGDPKTVIDQSDFPLTSLPYPCSASKPDFRERFGGSFAGREQMLQKYQRLGFGWTRWFPETKWQFFQPKSGAEFDWHDGDFEIAARYGVSQHIVLYGWPKWIMDEGGNPLPRDMRWPADDRRWEDLNTETAWDRYVKAAATHFKGHSIIFEIENEPEFDHWEKLKTEYAKLTLRTAKLIRATDPQAKIMVNNVYGVPSALNAEFFKIGGLKYVDVISWHDYHEGWLADAQSIKRMRQNMDEAGGEKVELWFNEGWAYTNTAVDEPIACTHLTAAQSTNAQADSVAEMTVSGQAKTILFHTGYEDHGQSFWDYSGPGTLLWDWYGYPLPLVSMWNVLNYHIGISDAVGFVRPPGANVTIFQDTRNGKGVMIAYADRESKEDATIALPDFGAPLIAEDLMGNAGPAPKKLVLSKTGRPVLLYSATKTAGKTFLAALLPFDRRNASFVSGAKGGEVPKWSLPSVWEGTSKGASDGSIATAGGKPVWKLEQLWPDDWKKRENFRPMTWTGTDWNVKEGGFGGQPGASLKDGALDLSTRAPHGTDGDRHLRTAGLTFVAPQNGTYFLHGSAITRMWDSKNKTVLKILKKTAQNVEEVGGITLEAGAETALEKMAVDLHEGDEMTLLPRIDGMFAGGDTKLKEFSITFGRKAASATASDYRLPAVWEGKKKGSSDGNPIAANSHSVWRLDRLYPGEAIVTSNYAPMTWAGSRWAAADHLQSGHPSAEVENGTVHLAALGPWTGDLNFPKIPVLTFIAPKPGIYRVTGTASSKPWEGMAVSIPLSFRKKDTQRSAEVHALQLPRDGSRVPFSFDVELNDGHELQLVPMMQELPNNATNVTIESLVVTGSGS